MHSFEMIKGILAAWITSPIRSVREIHPGRVFKVDCADGNPLILKDAGEANPQLIRRLEFEHEVLRHLHRANIPVAVPVLDREGNSFVFHDGHLYTLSPYLETNNRWLDLDLQGLKRLNYNCGAAIARLHLALVTFPKEKLERRTWRTVLPDVLLEECIPAIKLCLSGQDRTDFDAIISDVAEEMHATMIRLPEQLIHRDCHHGNIIMDGEQVSGFVDCDHISLGPRVFDIADFIVHMIKQDIADPKRTSDWFSLFPQVLEGYQEESALLEVEKGALYVVMLGVLLMFVDWFFKVGNPEKARSVLDAFVWMYRNQKAIRVRIA